MTSERCKILILDANQRSALAAVRSLGKVSGNIVHAADYLPQALAGTSRYCSQYHQHPSPISDYNGFVAWLITFVRDNAIQFLLPMTEISSRTALSIRDELGSCALPFPAMETVLALSDKWRLIQLANQVGVQCPESTYFTNADELLKNAPQNFPVVIKPALSRILHDGRWISTAVHIARTSSDLTALLNTYRYLQEHPVIVQEFIPGHGAGIFALYQNGEPVVFFAHRRIREKPPSGGVSVLSESVAPSPELETISRRLLGSVKWHGVAMVEFRIAPDGTPYLMEVNTRFWGSLQLAIDSGVDFPKLLQESAMSSAPSNAGNPYKIGQRLRWLLGDADNLLLTLRAKNNVSDKLVAIARFLAPYPLATKHEINRWDDLRPALFELKDYLRNLFKL